MREVIADQLAEGRTPDEIRTWFATRYGQEVLLDPPRYGAGWLSWVFPLAGGATAAWFALRGHRTRSAWVAAGSAAEVEHYAAVTRLAPADDRAHYLLAFALVRSDRLAEAEPILAPLIQRNPDHPESLLLGSLRQDRGDPGAEELLDHFLDVAPDHLAADDVAAELAGDGDRDGGAGS